MKKARYTLLLFIIIICLVAGSISSKLFEQPSEKEMSFLDGVSMGETVLTEEQLKKDILIIAENCNVLPYTNTYDVYENNGNTAFTFPKEDGYQKGGVTLDFNLIIAYGADKSVGRIGCIEVEYVLALWKYFLKRELPFNVDAVNVNFSVNGTYITESSFAFTRFSITKSEVVSLFERISADEMEEAEKIKRAAIMWCDENNYHRNGTNVQPYTRRKK